MAWVEFFAMLRSKGRAGVFVEGFLALTFGAFIVSFHGVWSGLPAVLSVVGVLQVVKGALRFCAPGLGLRAYERMVPARARSIQAGGVVAIALGALFGYIWLAH
jgi:hypothetical protein